MMERIHKECGSTAKSFKTNLDGLCNKTLALICGDRDLAVSGSKAELLVRFAWAIWVRGCGGVSQWRRRRTRGVGVYAACRCEGDGERGGEDEQAHGEVSLTSRRARDAICTAMPHLPSAR